MPTNSGIWKMQPIPKELDYLSDVKKQRIVKICPHRYLKKYDVSIWIDGSIEILDDLHKFISQYDLSKCPFYTRVHPRRRCIYEEAKACISLKKDDPSVICAQIERYKEEGYPKNIGMVETCILLRKHNDIRCQLLDDLWATELLKGSCRDQLSFNYACWKQHFLVGAMKNEFKVTSSMFKLHQHLNLWNQ